MPDPNIFRYPYIHVSGALPEMVESALYQVLYEQRSTLLTLDKIDGVAKTLQSKKNPDYETDWASFSYLYFAANYVKAFLATRTISLPMPRHPFRILDLGCGAGAATIGVISALKSTLLGFESRACQIIGVDKSGEQLDLFNKVTKPWAKSVLPHTTIETKQDDVLEYLKNNDCSAELVILCYLTTELSIAENYILRKLLREKLGDGREALIIESDPAKRGIQVELINGSRRRVTYDDIKLQMPLLESLKIGRPPKFSCRSTHLDILDRYFGAWVNHHASAIRDIFDAKATYEILGSKTLRGIDEIVAYWEHNSRTQRNVKCGWTKINAIPNGIAATWSATFDRIDCGETRKLNGMLQLTIKNQKITELSEAYAQYTVPMPLDRGT